MKFIEMTSTRQTVGIDVNLGCLLLCDRIVVIVLGVVCCFSDCPRSCFSECPQCCLLF